MIDTSSFETKVVISKFTDDGTIHHVDFRDITTDKVLSTYKYRVRKPKEVKETEQ